MGFKSLLNFRSPRELQSVPSSDKHLREFRHMWRKIFTPEVALDPPLRNIVAVGADYRRDAGLNERDKAWLSHTLKFCYDNNVTVPPDFTFTPVNYANGHDFLKRGMDIKADILISCFIVDADKWPKALRESPSARRYDTQFLVSPLHSQSAWREAAERTGARLVVTFEREREIGVSHFSGATYKAARVQEVIAPPTENGDWKYWMGSLLREDLAAEIVRREKSVARTEPHTAHL